MPTHLQLFIGCCGVIAFKFLSNGDNSFLITMGEFASLVGFTLLLMRILTCNSVEGMSLNSVLCYGSSFAMKLFCFSLFEGYIPEDSTGDYLYYALNVGILMLSMAITYLFVYKFNKTYSRNLDLVHFMYLAVATGILALAVHPGLNNDFTTDTVWTWSFYLNSVAIFPQIFMFSKKGEKVEAMTSHFVAAQFISAILKLSFHIQVYDQINDLSSQISDLGYISGHFIVIFAVMELGLFAEFIYYYALSLAKGEPLQMPAIEPVHT